MLKLIEATSNRWRYVNGHPVALVRAGAKFERDYWLRYGRPVVLRLGTGMQVGGHSEGVCGNLSRMPRTALYKATAAQSVSMIQVLARRPVSLDAKCC